MVDYALDYTQSTLWKRRGYTKSNIYIRKNRKALDLIRSLPPLKKKVISNKHLLKTSINNKIDDKYAGRSLRRSSQVLHKIHKYETLSNKDNNKRTLYKKKVKQGLYNNNYTRVKVLSPTEFNFNF